MQCNHDSEQKNYRRSAKSPVILSPLETVLVRHSGDGVAQMGINERQHRRQSHDDWAYNDSVFFEPNATGVEESLGSVL